MARITKEEMEKRENALQDLLEDASPEGATVNELITGLKTKGIELPKSEYQAVLIVLKHAEKAGVTTKVGKKWMLLDVSEEIDSATPTETIDIKVNPTSEETISLHATVA